MDGFTVFLLGIVAIACTYYLREQLMEMVDAEQATTKQIKRIADAITKGE